MGLIFVPTGNGSKGAETALEGGEGKPQKE